MNEKESYIVRRGTKGGRREISHSPDGWKAKIPPETTVWELMRACEFLNLNVALIDGFVFLVQENREESPPPIDVLGRALYCDPTTYWP